MSNLSSDNKITPEEIESMLKRRDAVNSKIEVYTQQNAKTLKEIDVLIEKAEKELDITNITQENIDSLIEASEKEVLSQYAILKSKTEEAEKCL